jgi:hypothetical protein
MHLMILWLKRSCNIDRCLADNFRLHLILQFIASKQFLLIPERVVIHEPHELVQKLLVVGAPTDQTGMRRRPNWYAASATCTKNPLPGRVPIGDGVPWVDLASVG